MPKLVEIAYDTEMTADEKINHLHLRGLMNELCHRVADGEISLDDANNFLDTMTSVTTGEQNRLIKMIEEFLESYNKNA